MEISEEHLDLKDAVLPGIEGDRKKALEARNRFRLLAAKFPVASQVAERALALIGGQPVLRATVITLWYMGVVSFANCGAFVLRFDGQIPFQMRETLVRTLPILLLVRIITFQRFGLYSGLLGYVSVEDVWRAMKAVAISTLMFMVIIYLVQDGFHGYPRSVFVVDTMLTLGILAGHRMFLRGLRESRRNGTGSRSARERSNRQKILVVGDLDAADSLLRALGSKQNGNGAILGIVHDDPLAKGKRLRGIQVLGSFADLPELVRVKKPTDIFILPPYTGPKSLREIVESCPSGGSTNLRFQMVPSLTDIAEGKTTVSMIRKVEIEDLLGRPPVKMDRTEVRAFLQAKAVMVTGAGGSIGSELCRQIGNYRPSRLVLHELNEFNLYQIDRDLRSRYPGLEVIPVAGDVCDERKLARVVDVQRIEVIYHAAAYKHVPLMESNVAACVKTNVLGTDCVARVAERFGVRQLVLISSDKAVRPTSVMGASKRLAERVILERPQSSTRFLAVRFGNVLGSSGSVIPLFKEQIAKGGPVTVTHPEITRYFMSIPEAVDLVLQAAVVGMDREIMVLEMGEPVKIADLAKRLIGLSGLRAHKDIEIVYTGLRPGEKLCEELMTADDGVVRTEYEKIWVLRNCSAQCRQLDPVDFPLLERAIQEDDEGVLRSLIRRWIPDNLMHSAEHESQVTVAFPCPARVSL